MVTNSDIQENSEVIQTSLKDLYYKEPELPVILNEDTILKTYGTDLVINFLAKIPEITEISDSTAKSSYTERYLRNLNYGESVGSLLATISKKVSLFRSIGQRGANILGGKQDENGIRHGSDAGVVAAGFMNPMSSTTSLISDIKSKDWGQFAKDLLIPGFGSKARNDKLKEEKLKVDIYNGINILLNGFELEPIVELSPEAKANLSILEVFNSIMIAQNLQAWDNVLFANINILTAINLGFNRIDSEIITKDKFILIQKQEDQAKNEKIVTDQNKNVSIATGTKQKDFLLLIYDLIYS